MNRLNASFDRHADRLALSVSGKQVSYRSLLRLIDDRIRMLDDVRGDRVAWQLDNSLEWVTTSLAVLMSGRTAVPIPHFFSAAQCQHVLADSGADLFIGTEAPGAGWSMPRETRIWRSQERRHAAVPEGCALITYTSGTTGRARGVCLSTDTLLDTASSIVSELSPVQIERHLCMLPLSLLLENVAGLLANLLNGGTTVLAPLADLGMTGSSSLDLETLVRAQNVIQPQSVILVPQLLLALTTAAELGFALPESYRFMAVGGARVSPQLLARARAAGLPAYEGYGLTECGSVISLNVPGRDRPGSAGQPLPHVQLQIEDGEITVGRPQHLGYTGIYDTGTGERRCSGAAHRTGDLGGLDAEGFLHIRGRKKHHYISAYGRNINPEWIESELTSELSIAQAIVFGEGQPNNVALLIPRMDADDSAIGQAVAASNARLPDYAKISAWQRLDAGLFAQSGCLTDNGRVRRELAARYFSRSIDQLFENLPEYS